jgi:hypothetical protein
MIIQQVCDLSPSYDSCVDKTLLALMHFKTKGREKELVADCWAVYGFAAVV